MKRIAIIAALIALTGCVSEGMDSGMKSMIGESVDVAIAKLGYPDSQQEIMGQTVYTWATNVQGADCTLKVAVNDAKVITHSQWAGNMYGCESYARALGR